MLHSSTHGILDFLQHLWPYVLGVFTAIGTAFGMYWADRRDTKRRVINLEKLIELLSERSITHADLAACREDVRASDDAAVGKIYQLIRENNVTNAEQHNDIMKEIIALHSGDRKK